MSILGDNRPATGASDKANKLTFVDKYSEIQRLNQTENATPVTSV